MGSGSTMTHRMLVLVAMATVVAAWLPGSVPPGRYQDPIEGLWTKIEGPYLPVPAGFPFYFAGEVTSFCIITALPGRKSVFNVQFTSIQPAYNITDEMRSNGPDIFAPMDGVPSTPSAASLTSAVTAPTICWLPCLMGR
ncbi:hypothetical protein FOA52_000637 [Chlamydomonas sp. UWO 241]|nr:hypothetical protein FOA52_000637 [Chlamydomonas sp. UWO 241]